MLFECLYVRSYIFITVYRPEIILSVLLVITNIYRYVTIDLKHNMIYV